MNMPHDSPPMMGAPEYFSAFGTFGEQPPPTPFSNPRFDPNPMMAVGPKNLEELVRR
jgi:hypothetical protein